MVLGNSETIGGRQGRYIRFAIGSQILRTRQRGIEQTFIAHSRRAAMVGYALAMQQQ